jgi:hypothetical protein
VKKTASTVNDKAAAPVGAGDGAAAARRVVFPVLLEFAVERYPLYPAADGCGIRFPVPPGVSIIAGINGLGKTTLLNVLFRTLSGPVEWKKRKLGELAGSSRIDLGPWRDGAYFKNRVPNAAKGATVTATVGFGDRRVRVTRSLETLAVTALSVDGAERSANQGEYQAVVCELSGISRYADFFLLLRYLVFFLEERQPLVWDPDAQTDLLRVLFFDAAAAGHARELFDDIQRLDSDYRNQRYHLGKLQERLARAKAANSGSAETLSTIASVATRLRALEDEEEDLGRRLDEADGARRTQRLRLEQAKVRLTEVQREYAHAERHHFATLFPAATEIAAQVLVQVGTGGGCLVCGNRGPSALSRVRACAADGRCPVCDSRLEEQEGVVPASRVGAKRLEALEREAQAAADAVRGLDAALADSARAYDEIANCALAVRRERDEEERKLEALQANLPLDDAEAAELGRTVNTLEGDLKRLRAQLTALEVEYAALLRAGEVQVRKASDEIARRFAEFARHFLADDSDLEYVIDRRMIGEVTRKFEFPRFVVRLASAGLAGVQPRREAYEVSESQKEFLDLAFRMAVIEVAAAGAPSMLILETPEASLDSVFMLRAGELLGRYATGGGGGNRLIATSNLTRGEMISALLGAVALPGEKARMLAHHVPQARRRERVVDLLRDAAPNAALRKYRREYERDLENALFPERAGGRGAGARSGKQPANAGRAGGATPAKTAGTAGRSARQGTRGEKGERGAAGGRRPRGDGR